MAHTVQISEIPAYALDLFNEIAVKEGFSDYTITSTAGTKHGDGFLGIMIRVTIAGQRKKAGDTVATADSLPLVCKIPPPDQQRREMFSTSKAFISEIYSYDVFLPALAKFQAEIKISQADGFFEFPKSYGTYSDLENGNFVLALEDLKVHGYDMFNKLEDLDFTHASLVLKKLGKFHALSFAIRDQRPEVFAEFTKKRPEYFLEELRNEQSLKFWYESYATAKNILEPENKDLYQRFEQLESTFKDKLIACLTDCNDQFSVMSHGDFWTNNFMYKYANGSKVPQDACLIDWQIIQFCSPALDFSFFIFSSTNATLRAEHYDDLVQIYYDSLAETLQRLGSDPERLFRFSDFLDQLKKFSLYGFLMSPMFIPIVTANSSDIPDLNELANRDTNSVSFVNNTNDLYKERMISAIRFFFSKDFNL